MRLLFLDIDGVLNSDLWYKSEQCKKQQEPLNHFDPKNVSILNNLVKKTEAKVVITSTWRNNHSQEDLKQILKAAGLKIEIVGFTPDLRRNQDFVIRGNEILKWCMDNEVILGCEWKSYHDFAILDDNSDFLLWQAHNFFRTDRFCGLTLTVKKEIERFFERKNRQ
ncbi:MAG: HAD domain-containing protein [Flavobacteriales bacterium]|nr:HAD domain-containing protein [Flavobacteriales bacterium]